MKRKLKLSFLFVCASALLACSGNKVENNGQKNNEQNNTNENTENNENNNENNNQENEDDNEPFVENELSIENGLKIKFSNIGAKIDSVKFGDLKIAENGFVPIRVANRIANGSFELDGVTYDNLTKNDSNKHTLHGGYDNMAQNINWTKTKQNAHEIVFEYDSPDKEQGFPGNMHISTTYSLKTDGTLDIEFRAKSDAKTLFNPTNHLYMNLNGVQSGWNLGAIKDHKLWVDAEKYTKVDNEKIPTGEIVSVAGTKLDYTTKTTYVGDNDTNVVLNGEGYRKVAELTGDTSGITCEVFTDRVGLQIYNDTSAHICLEAQDFPDAIHHDNFPSIVLEANEEYYSKTSYKFSK